MQNEIGAQELHPYNLSAMASEAAGPDASLGPEAVALLAEADKQFEDGMQAISVCIFSSPPPPQSEQTHARTHASLEALGPSQHVLKHQSLQENAVEKAVELLAQMLLTRIAPHGGTHARRQSLYGLPVAI